MIDKGKCLLGKHSIIDSVYADLLLYQLMTLQVDSHFELLQINLYYDKAEIFWIGYYLTKKIKLGKLKCPNGQMVVGTTQYKKKMF